MQLLTLKLYYLRWHYTRAFVDLLNIWMNFLWFTWNFFSMGLLLRTLFSPWRRLHEERRGGLDLADIGSVLFVNLIMRIVGALIRIWVVLLGLFVSLMVFFGGVIFFLAWTAMPVIIAFLFIAGIFLLELV